MTINKAWLKAAAVRAVKTMAQTAVAMLPAAAAITQVDWVTVIGTAALAAVASLLTSLAGLPEVADDE
ncbi:MAG: holin [Clostridiales bacterium]|nr:holin [Clostridiales bacterium]